MIIMSYAKKTNLLKIPYMGFGDIMTEQDNKNQMEVIDRLLYINNLRAYNCILKEGNYNYVIDENNNDFSLIISNQQEISSESQLSSSIENNHSFSLMGILNKKLFYNTNEITISGLSFNTKYYFYIESSETEEFGFNIVYYTEEELKNELNIETSISQNDLLKLSSNNIRMPICIITSDNEDIDINIDIEEKYYNKDINIHHKYISFLSSESDYEYSFPANKKIIFATVYAEEENMDISWHIDNENKKIIFKTIGNDDVKINVKLDLEEIMIDELDIDNNEEENPSENSNENNFNMVSGQLWGYYNGTMLSSNTITATNTNVVADGNGYFTLGNGKYFDLDEIVCIGNSPRTIVLSAQLFANNPVSFIDGGNNSGNNEFELGWGRYNNQLLYHINGNKDNVEWAELLPGSYLLAFVYDGTHITCYKNGVELVSSELNDINTGAEKTYHIGESYYKGLPNLINEWKSNFFAIYNRALTANEIQSFNINILE